MAQQGHPGGDLYSTDRTLKSTASAPISAAESGKVLKRFNARNKEVGSPSYCCEGWKARHLLSDRTLWNCKIKRAVLSADHRIAFVAQLVEIWIVDPNVLDEFELADEALGITMVQAMSIVKAIGVGSGAALRGVNLTLPNLAH